LPPPTAQLLPTTADLEGSDTLANLGTDYFPKSSKKGNLRKSEAQKSEEYKARWGGEENGEVNHEANEALVHFCLQSPARLRHNFRKRIKPKKDEVL